jgi:hypothetical protein
MGCWVGDISGLDAVEKISESNPGRPPLSIAIPTEISRLPRMGDWRESIYNCSFRMMVVTF